MFGMRRMLSVAMLTAGSIVILALVVFGRSHTVKTPAATLPSADQRTAAVPFDATTIAGQQVSLASFKGRPLVINFFAAWCDPCKREAPELTRLEDRYGKNSTVLTSQLPTKSWHEALGEPTIADAICDRLVHNAHVLTLRGGSIRRQKGLKPQPDSHPAT